jgi:hypothetical protein
VHDQLAHRVASGLDVLDNFTFTPAIVTFVTWGLIGLVLFSLVQSLMRASGTLQFERDLSSNRYIHPQNFKRSTFWRHIIIDTTISFALLAVLAASAIMYLLFIVPVGFAYVQRVLVQFSLSNMLVCLVGAFTIFSGTLLLYLLLKITVVHYRFSIR